MVSCCPFANGLANGRHNDAVNSCFHEYPLSTLLKSIMHDIRWVINLGNSICGVALLVLPYCFSQCGVVLGAILLLFSALLTTWSCHLLLENVFACKAASYEGIAKELYGKSGKLLVEISATTLNIGCCSAFFVIISDLSPGVISWVTGTSSIDPNLHLIILTSLGLTIILPLSMIRNLEPLNYVSLASLTFYISLTVQLFLWAIKNGSDSEGGFASNLKLFDYKGIFHVLPIYALGFSCHLQLMAMTREVVGEVKEGMREELSRMKWISKGAVSIVAILYGSVSLFGHIAFCDNGVEADVLSNFNHGLVAQITRFGFAVSVLLSFPFMVNPCRAALYSLIYKRTDKMIPIQKHFILTFSIVFTAFFIAVTTPNVAVVVALTGAISGAIICYLFPAFSYLFNSKIKHTRKQRIRAWILICVGVVLLTLGTMSALSPSSTSSSHNKVGVDNNPKISHSNLVEHHDGEGGGVDGGTGKGGVEEVNPADLMGLLKTDKNILGEKKVKDEESNDKGDKDDGNLAIPEVVVKPPAPPDSLIITGVGEGLPGVARTLQEDKGGKEEGATQQQQSDQDGVKDQVQDTGGEKDKESAEDSKEQVSNDHNEKEHEEEVNSNEHEVVDSMEKDREKNDQINTNEEQESQHTDNENTNQDQQTNVEHGIHEDNSKGKEEQQEGDGERELTNQENHKDDPVLEASTPLTQTERPDTIDFVTADKEQQQQQLEGDREKTTVTDNKEPSKRDVNPFLDLHVNDSPDKLTVSLKPDSDQNTEQKHKVKNTRRSSNHTKDREQL